MTDLALVAPWHTDTVDLLSRTMTHVARPTLVTTAGERIPVELRDGRLGFDDTSSPRVQGTFSARLANDQALLSRIDPRAGVRLEVDLGYRHPDGLEDVHAVADLVLRSRMVRRPSDTLELEALSDESLLIDGAGTATGNISAASTAAAITAIIQQILPSASVTVSGPTGPAISGVLFDDRWDAVKDLADRIEAQVYDDGTGSWYITPSPSTTVSEPALELRVGAAGTIISSDTGLGRDDGFANLVWLRYEWTDGGGTDHIINATRSVTTGPYAPATAGYRIVKIDRSTGTTQTAANAAATALVRRMVTRGRSFTVEAVSAYWLRPGHTVLVQLPLGDPELHLVSAVEFDLGRGTMRVVTRLPDNTGTIG